jgi:hypothetical protein
MRVNHMSLASSGPQISGGQGWGRTADLPLFRRLGRSRCVHHRPPDQAIRCADRPWRPGSTTRFHSRR